MLAARAGNERVGDLAGATARLVVEHIRFQIVTQGDEGERAEQYEHDGEHPGVPGDGGAS